MINWRGLDVNQRARKSYLISTSGNYFLNNTRADVTLGLVGSNLELMNYFSAITVDNVDVESEFTLGQRKRKTSIRGKRCKKAGIKNTK